MVDVRKLITKVRKFRLADCVKIQIDDCVDITGEKGSSWKTPTSYPIGRLDQSVVTTQALTKVYNSATRHKTFPTKWTVVEPHCVLANFKGDLICSSQELVADLP